MIRSRERVAGGRGGGSDGSGLVACHMHGFRVHVNVTRIIWSA